VADGLGMDVFSLEGWAWTNMLLAEYIGPGDAPVYGSC